MQDSILKRLDAIEERHQEVEQLLAQPEVIADQEKFRELNREYSRLQVMVDTYKDYKTCSSDLEEMESMLNGDDEDMREFALVLVVTRLPYSQASSSVCTPSTVSPRAGL